MHASPRPHAVRGPDVDPDCDAPLDEIVDEIVERRLDTADGHAGWEHGMRLAERCADGFVADLLEMHGEHCTTAAGRADVRALAGSLMLPMAHQRVALEWHTAAGGGGADAQSQAADESTTDEPRRRAFKRGMFAGFLYGMADAVSRGVDGRALIEA